MLQSNNKNKRLCPRIKINGSLPINKKINEGKQYNKQ